MKRVQTVHDVNLDEQRLEFTFQKDLTQKLDNYNWDFNQNILNEIVLWKVNRYALFDHETISLLNTITSNTTQIDSEFTSTLLTHLLNTKWVKLAMASTILRFKNPSIYQIIDQRVYRIIYGVEMPKFTKIEDSIKLYLKYLEKLKEVCGKYKIDFNESDRVLYALDKEINSEFKIKY